MPWLVSSVLTAAVTIIVEEERLEREHFGWRPLLSAEALARKRRSRKQRFLSWIHGR